MLLHNKLLKFTLKCIPVMTTMERYNYMQELLKLLISLQGEYIDCIHSLVLYVNNICKKIYIEPIFSGDVEDYCKILSSSEHTAMIDTIPHFFEHCIRCDRTLFDIINKLDMVVNIEDLLKPFIDCDSLANAGYRTDDGFLLLQQGYFLHANPFIRLLNILKRRGWNSRGLEPVLPMGVSGYVSNEFIKGINVDPDHKIVIHYYERSEYSDDLIVCYACDSESANSPYLAIPLSTFQKSYKKIVDGIDNHKFSHDLLGELMRSQVEEYVFATCLEEMISNMNTKCTLPDISIFKSMCVPFLDEEGLKLLHHRYTFNCVNTAVIYYVIESLYMHRTGYKHDAKFIEGFHFMYGIDSFMDIFKNEFISYGLTDLMKSYVSKSMQVLAPLAYSYLYYTEPGYLDKLEYTDGKYYRYFSEDNILGFNVDNTSLLAKIILCSSCRHVRTLGEEDIKNLLPLCKYFFTQKWHMIKFIVPRFNIKSFEITGKQGDFVCADITLSDCVIELRMPNEQNKVYNKYVYEYSVKSIVATEGDNTDSYVSIIEVLDRIFNKGDFSSNERLVSIPVKCNHYTTVTRPDGKILYCDIDDSGNTTGFPPIILPYKSKHGESEVALNTGCIYSVEIEDDVIYFDKKNINNTAELINKSAVISEMGETSIFKN